MSESLMLELIRRYISEYEEHFLNKDHKSITCDSINNFGDYWTHLIGLTNGGVKPDKAIDVDPRFSNNKIAILSTFEKVYEHYKGVFEDKNNLKITHRTVKGEKMSL